MVKRENNSRRNYLLVNSLQGKHIPANPEKVLALFGQLAEEVKKHIGNEKTVFIGFAETATAVGAEVASYFKNAYYIHTTREISTPGKPVAEFKEEHSHAVEHLLYCDNWDEIIKDAEHIVFAEDEISTGKTIMNFVRVLKENNKVTDRIKFSACSILNGMSSEREAELLSEGMEFYWLLKHSAEPESEEVYCYTEKEITSRDAYSLDEITFNGMINPRTGICASEYKKACCDLAVNIRSRLCPETDSSIAVIGTEECMYPAICTAMELKKSGIINTVTHSTTRSPIIAENSENYPLKYRHRIESFYDKNRKTYIYNSCLSKYDAVIIVTDSSGVDYDFTAFSNAFSKSDSFTIVRWVK